MEKCITDFREHGLLNHALDKMPCLRNVMIQTQEVESDLDDKQLLELIVLLLNEHVRKVNEKHKIDTIAAQSYTIKEIGKAMGANLDCLLPACEETWSATEVGRKLGISPQKVGRLANQYHLKTEEYGIWVLDQSPNSAKQVNTFRYNQRGVDKLEELLASQ